MLTKQAVGTCWPLTATCTWDGSMDGTHRLNCCLKTQDMVISYEQGMFSCKYLKLSYKIWKLKAYTYCLSLKHAKICNLYLYIPIATPALEATIETMFFWRRNSSYKEQPNKWSKYLNSFFSYKGSEVGYNHVTKLMQSLNKNWTTSTIVVDQQIFFF